MTSMTRPAKVDRQARADSIRASVERHVQLHRQNLQSVARKLSDRDAVTLASVSVEVLFGELRSVVAAIAGEHADTILDALDEAAELVSA